MLFMPRLRRLALLFTLVVLSACASLSGTNASEPLGACEGEACTLVIRDVTVTDVVARRFLPGQDILVRDGRILAVGPRLQAPVPSVELDGSRWVALPGFINTHTHLWQHMARGFEPSGNLQTWVRIYRYAHYLSPSGVHDITLAAANQALLSGITTCVDFASVNFRDGNLDATVQALRRARLDGAVVWWSPAAFLPPEVREAELTRLQHLAPERVGVWMGFGPLSFYEVPAVYDGILTAKKLGLRMTEHTMENVQEQRDLFTSLKAYLGSHGASLASEDRAVLDGLVRRGPPASPDAFVQLQRLASRLLADPSLPEEQRRQLTPLAGQPTISPVPLLEHLGVLPGFLSIHSVWQDASDLALYRQRGVAISYNPESNMYLASGVAPVLDALQEPPLVVSLGTDGAASNDGIDFFSAMRAAVNLQKVDALAPTRSSAFGPWQVLQAATIQGARAMGQADRIGSLAAGMEADIILLSKDRLGLSPLLVAPTGGVDSSVAEQWASMIVNSAGPRDIALVLSNGHAVVRDGKLVDFDEKELARRLDAVTADAVQRQQAGDQWAEQFVLKTEDVDPRWFRYRSVRKLDAFRVEVRNGTDRPLSLVVAFSGTTFGGTAAPMLHPEALRRFPSTPPAAWWTRTVRLEPGQSALLSKEGGGIASSLAFPGGVEQRQGATAEQLLLLAQPVPTDGLAVHAQ